MSEGTYQEQSGLVADAGNDGTIVDSGLRDVPSTELLRKLADMWLARRTSQELKVGSVKERAAQLEFFLGAMAAGEITQRNQLPGMALVMLSVGRDSVKEWGTKPAEVAA